MMSRARFGVAIATLAIGAAVFSPPAGAAPAPLDPAYAIPAELGRSFDGPLSPSYCYSTGQWVQFPEFSGYCPDGQGPFDGPGPSYGGGNHRWPDGSDD